MMSFKVRMSINKVHLVFDIPKSQSGHYKAWGKLDGSFDLYATESPAKRRRGLLHRRKVRNGVEYGNIACGSFGWGSKNLNFERGSDLSGRKIKQALQNFEGKPISKEFEADRQDGLIRIPGGFDFFKEVLGDEKFLGNMKKLEEEDKVQEDIPGTFQHELKEIRISYEDLREAELHPFGHTSDANIVAALFDVSLFIAHLNVMPVERRTLRGTGRLFQGKKLITGGERFRLMDRVNRIMKYHEWELDCKKGCFRPLFKAHAHIESTYTSSSTQLDLDDDDDGLDL